MEILTVRELKQQEIIFKKIHQLLRECGIIVSQKELNASFHRSEICPGWGMSYVMGTTMKQHYDVIFSHCNS